MRFTELAISGAYLIDVDPIEDSRGFFAKVLSIEELQQYGWPSNILQVNNSYNHQKGTLRGLHYQIPPHQEAKLIRVIQGALWDVIVDLRPNSPTFGEWTSLTLSASQRNMILVPPGCAHGLMTLVDHTEMMYFVSENYHPASERGIRWDDPTFGIEWPMPPTVISEKDANAAIFDRKWHLWYGA